MNIKCPNCGTWSQPFGGNYSGTENSNRGSLEVSPEELKEEGLTLLKQWKMVEKTSYVSPMLSSAAALYLMHKASKISKMLPKINRFKCPDCGHECTMGDAISGMISSTSDKPFDNYMIMKTLVEYKERNNYSSVHNTIPQFSESFNQLSISYINGFLDIPVIDRKFLVIDKEFRYLPDSFVVLPENSLPHDIKFPSGHPHCHELYVVHPYKPNEYIPYNDYQFSLFRDEIREFSWIMECLGAKSISFHETQLEETNETNDSSAKSKGKANYSDFGSSGSYDRSNTSTEYRKLTSELKEKREFSITKTILPYLPQDVVWYQHRPEWHRYCESRKIGRLSKASFKLSTSSITATSNQERKKIEADLKILLFKASGSHEQEEKVQLRSEENHTWSVDVEFYPMEEYDTKKKVIISDSPHTLIGQHSEALQEKKKPNYLIFSLLAIIIVLIVIILATIVF